MDKNMTLEKRIDAELYSYQGRMSVFVDDLQGHTVERGADEEFETASVIKAFLLAALYLRRGWLAQLGRSVGAYLGGLALATLPWVVYFGVHGALGDWFTAYFYDNLFLYKGAGGGLPALAQHLWWAVRDGLPAALLLAAFLLWTLLTRRFAAAGGWPLPV